MDLPTKWLLSVLLLALVSTMGVLGQDITMTSSTVRLVNGATNYGRLEVFHNEQWGTVCDDNFDEVDAEVACRQLGLDTGTVMYYAFAQFGEGTGFIWLDELMCNGSESSLFSCKHNIIGEHDCSHSEDVGVSCGYVSTDILKPESGSVFSFGSWIGFAVGFIIITVAISVYRRKRLNMYRRSQQATTTTTTTVLPPPMPTNNPGNTAMPTYYHNAQQPGATPAPPPGSYPVQAQQPQQPYPQQPYPQQPYPQQPYPQQPYPQAPNPDSAYPPPQTGGAPPPMSNPYPAQAAPQHDGSAPYPPPQQVGGDAPPMYPPQANAPPTSDLPPPPAYDDVVKQ